MAEYRKRLGQLIRNARVMSGLTQSQLAQQIGVTGVAVCNYENGHRWPNVETLSRISQATNTSITLLVPRAEMPEPEHDDRQTTIFEVLGDD